MLLAIPAAFSSALLGTHPVQVQSPPSLFASIRAVFAPSEAEIPAAVSPAAPPPITTMSKSITIGNLADQMTSPFQVWSLRWNSHCENLYHDTPFDANPRGFIQCVPGTTAWGR